MTKDVLRIQKKHDFKRFIKNLFTKWVGQEFLQTRVKEWSKIEKISFFF